MTLSAERLAAAGSVTGADHRRAERDGQDGCAVVTTDDVVAAIVTDGCSSGRASEVGARVGAAWLAASVARRFRSGASTDEDARAGAADVTRELVERLADLAPSLGERAATEMLLFGFLAAVVTREIAIVFGVGDGLAVVEATAGRFVVRVDPGPQNAPPYPAYALFGDAQAIAPRVHWVSAAANVAAIAVGTDGVGALSDDEIAEAARDPRLAKNASLLRKRLVVLAREGRFFDDATLGVVARRPR